MNKGEQGEQGEKGDRGEQGQDGADGYTPQIGLNKGTDGNWYWTLDNQLMTDPQGNPIRANGQNGQDGADGEDGQDGADGQDAPTPLIKLGSTITASNVMTDNGNTLPDAWYLSVDGGQTWYRISGDKGEQGEQGSTGAQGPQGPQGPAGADGEKGEDGKDGDSWFSEAPRLSDDGTHYIFTLTSGGTLEVPAYRTLQIGEGEGTLSLENTATDIAITLPTGTTASDYTALVAQVTPEGANGTYTDIATATRADNAGGWSVKATLAEGGSKVTVTAPQDGSSALLRVTLIDNKGGETTASCILTTSGYTYDEATKTYKVYTAEGLQAWAEESSSDSISYTTNCILERDITLPDNWMPVCQDKSVHAQGYNGIFDGQGHTISHVSITAKDTKMQGLIGYLGENGVVKNLNLVINTITGTEYAGGIAGYNKGVITNCHVTEEEEGTGIHGKNETSYDWYIYGGIAGENAGKIIACTAACTIAHEGENLFFNIGGITGYNFSGQIIACYEECTINSPNVVESGGIIGFNSSSAQAVACYATGTGANAGVAGYCENNRKDMRFAACYWSGEAANAFNDNAYPEADQATKINGDVTWAIATTDMNNAIKTWNAANDNACPYHYVQTGNANEPPVLAEGTPQ